MLNTLGIVQLHGVIRSGESKIGRKLSGKSLLEWVVRRATDCLRLDDVVVVLAPGEHEALVRSLVPPDVSVLQPGKRDPLASVVAAIDKYRARSIVRLYADNPFVDPVLIDRLVSTADAHPQCDYIGYCRADGRPAVLTHVGVVAEWCSAEALRRADRDATRAADRQHVTSYLFAHPEQFNVRLVPLPTELDRDDLRLRIDVEEDWDHAQVLFEALGGDEWDWQRVADLLDTQPALRKRMAVLNRS